MGDVLVGAAMLAEELPQEAILLSDSAGCELYLGRGLDALQLTRPEALLELGEVFPPPSARSPLVVADTCEIGLVLNLSQTKSVGYCFIDKLCIVSRVRGVSKKEEKGRETGRVRGVWCRREVVYTTRWGFFWAGLLSKTGDQLNNRPVL